MTKHDCLRVGKTTKVNMQCHLKHDTRNEAIHLASTKTKTAGDPGFEQHM
jgi:hypothetical protein